MWHIYFCTKALRIYFWYLLTCQKYVCTKKSLFPVEAYITIYIYEPIIPSRICYIFINIFILYLNAQAVVYAHLYMLLTRFITSLPLLFYCLNSSIYIHLPSILYSVHTLAHDIPVTYSAYYIIFLISVSINRNGRKCCYRPTRANNLICILLGKLEIQLCNIYNC